MSLRAHEVVRRCRAIAACSEAPGATTRTFLSEPAHAVHTMLGSWMNEAGMTVRVDAAGNLRGTLPGSSAEAPRLYIGSHLDTVPDAGAFDGVLGVVMGAELVGLLAGRPLPFAIEVVGFSDEEGVRFGVPFIGSRAFVGTLDAGLMARTDARGVRVDEAIRQFGLDPAQLPAARPAEPALGYLEFHIEQGPVLDQLAVPIGIVEAIAGQTRLDVTFSGLANHAGTTPMRARRDALAGAAAWTLEVERHGGTVPGLVATVGSLQIAPNATNVIAGRCRASLDVRHAVDATRRLAADQLTAQAAAIARARGLSVQVEPRLDQAAVAMHPALIAQLARAAERVGVPVHRMASGAGHDAMVVAAHMPAAMVFVRSPHGISHHPDETVREEDVAAALDLGLMAIESLAMEAAR